MSTQSCWEKRLRAWEIHKPSLQQMVGAAGSIILSHSFWDMRTGLKDTLVTCVPLSKR